jgi:hypothetical protein
MLSSCVLSYPFNMILEIYGINMSEDARPVKMFSRMTVPGRRGICYIKGCYIEITYRVTVGQVDKPFIPVLETPSLFLA